MEDDIRELIKKEKDTVENCRLFLMVVQYLIGNGKVLEEPILTLHDDLYNLYAEVKGNSYNRHFHERTIRKKMLGSKQHVARTIMLARKELEKDDDELFS